MSTRTILTADDILRLSEQGRHYELVDGELVEMSPTSFRHGQIESRVVRRLADHVESGQLGEVVVGDVLFVLDRDAGLYRAADVAFVRHERLRGQTLTGAFDGAPDLAVEIVSPGNTAEEIQRKVGDWLDHGALAVLLMFPDDCKVVLWRGNQGMTLGESDVLDLDPSVPGFRCPVADLFPPPVEEDDADQERAGEPSDR